MGWEDTERILAPFSTELLEQMVTRWGMDEPPLDWVAEGEEADVIAALRSFYGPIEGSDAHPDVGYFGLVIEECYRRDLRKQYGGDELSRAAIRREFADEAASVLGIARATQEAASERVPARAPASRDLLAQFDVMALFDAMITEPRAP